MSADSTYQVFFGGKANLALSGFLKKIKHSGLFIICDSNTLQFCLPVLMNEVPSFKKAKIIELEPGEENKDIQVTQGIWQTLTEGGADKNALIINLGGGTVCDTGAFAASLYKRGLDFVHVPTSLLAMADASVGGKNGINFSGIKNLIGTINQPKAVFVNPGFLNTLPFRQLLNGFAEVVKMALILDKKFFKTLCAVKIDQPFDAEKIISKSVALKSSVVKKDPFDKGIRRILNFGHTVGHAIESHYLAKGKDMLHGEAVAIGMAIESYLGFLLKRYNKNELNDILNLLSTNFELRLINESSLDEIFTYLRQDKKNSGKNLNFSLLRKIGHCDINIKASELQVKKAFAYYNANIANASAL